MRVWNRIATAHEVAKGPKRRRIYDKTEKHRSKLSEGSLHLRENVALLLLYQPDGILESTHQQIDHLMKEGFVPILVSNVPILEKDKPSLLAKCHLLLERPNVGYDFGGYRDGILLLLERGIRPENLLVLNDSIWFPLKANCDVIRKALRAPEDMFGIFHNTKSHRDKHRHLQSYFYRFRGHMLDDPNFVALWRDMPFYDDKELVIRILEVRMTGKIKELGYSTSALLTPTDVLDAANRLDDEKILEVAQYHWSTTKRGNAIFSRLAKMTPNDPNWKSERERAIVNSRFRYYCIDAHPYILTEQLDCIFLKKSLEYHYCVQREELVRLGLHKDFDPVIRDEIENWNSLGTPKPPELSKFTPYAERYAS